MDRITPEMPTMAATARFEGLHPVFGWCVDRHAVRYNLARPWVHEGHVWATDGRILARVPVGEVDASIVALYAPRPGTHGQTTIADPERAFRDADPWEADPTPLPLDRLPAFDPKCRECGGNGISGGGECEDCGGDGINPTLVYGWDEADCIEVGRMFFAAQALAMLAGFGVTGLCLPEGELPERGRAARFVVGGTVEGLLMPKRKVVIGLPTTEERQHP